MPDWGWIIFGVGEIVLAGVLLWYARRMMERI